MVLLAAGCVSVQDMPTPIDKRPFTFQLGPGDVLTIEVYKEQDLRRSVTVSPDGHITFPLVGTLHVLDRTVNEVAEAVHKGLLEVMTEPVVTVTLERTASARVNLLGQVGRQGSVPYVDRLTLVDAIVQSGGVDWRTAETQDVRIIRGPVDDPLVIEADLTNILKAAERDIFLEPGDIVYVPARLITRFDWTVQQMLSPIQSVVGAGSQARLVTGTFGQ